MSLFSSLQARRRAEIFREMFQRAHDWIWRESAESTERTEFHGVAKIFQHSDVRRASLARPDLVNGFDAARQADTTWRAFAAGLMAQNSIANRACFAMSTVSSKTTMPP